MANGFNFPLLFNGQGTNIISGAPCVIKDLNLLVKSELFEFRYDPAYGSNIPLLKFKPRTPLTKDLVIDAIYELQNYCPNIRFDRTQVQVSYPAPATMQINIPAIIDNHDYITDLVLYVEATA